MVDPKARKEKQQKKYAKLNPEWRQNCLQMTDDQLEAEILKVALSDLSNKMAQEMDPDIADLKEKLTVATEPYKSIANENKIKTPFVVEILEGRGKDVPSYASFLKKAAKSLLEKTA
jgi:hypothetical protein